MNNVKRTKRIKCVGNDATTNGCLCPRCREHDSAHTETLRKQAEYYREKYPFSYSIGLEDGWLILSAEIEAVLSTP